jgi:hypothetical protein
MTELDSEHRPLINVTSEDVRFSGKSDENKDEMEFKEESDVPKGRNVRSSWLRWVMLACGSIFLMGSYFCYDGPAPLTVILEDKNLAYDFSPL